MKYLYAEEQKTFIFTLRNPGHCGKETCKGTLFCSSNTTSAAVCCAKSQTRISNKTFNGTKNCECADLFIFFGGKKFTDPDIQK